MEQEWFQITKHPAQAITPKKSRFNRLRGYIKSKYWKADCHKEKSPRKDSFRILNGSMS